MPQDFSADVEWLPATPVPDRLGDECYVIYRSVAFNDGTPSEHYCVSGVGRLAPAEFNDWLTMRSARTTGESRVRVLAIREQRSADGALLVCTLERRMGSAGGSYIGVPARVEFSGAARQMRVLHASLGGQPRETVSEFGLPSGRTMRTELFAGEEQALRDALGMDLRIVAMREPSAVEELVGLSTLYDVETTKDGLRTYGVGWHGTICFVLHADIIPRGTEVVRSPVDPDAAKIADGAPTDHGFPSGWRDRVNPDQARWLLYAERYEGLAILDVYADRAPGAVHVLASSPGRGVTRHRIDRDGVELSCEPGEQPAV